VENDANLSITKPTGLAEGDLLVGFLFQIGQGSAWTTPTDWDAITGVSFSTSRRLDVFAKLADAADVAAADFTFNQIDASGVTKTGVLYRITGTLAGAENITASTSDIGTEVADDEPRYATGIVNVANALMIMFSGGAVTNNGTSTVSGYLIENDNPTWTERADFGFAASVDSRCGSATATRTAVTNTGYYQVDYNSTDNLGTGSVGALLAISDTANVTVSPDVVATEITMPAPTVAAGATVSADTIAAEISIKAPTVATADAKWSNQAKNSSVWTNQDKS